MRTRIAVGFVVALTGLLVPASSFAQPGGIYEDDPYYEPDGYVGGGVFGRWTIAAGFAFGGIIAAWLWLIYSRIEDDIKWAVDVAASALEARTDDASLHDARTLRRVFPREIMPRIGRWLSVFGWVIWFVIMWLAAREVV